MIVGAGLSGLCLAQRLRTDGWDVHVFERDASPEIRGQGYRLTIDATGAAALRDCLPSSVYELVRGTSKRASDGGGFVFLDERAKELHRFVVRSPEGTSDLATGQVDRATLRRALLVGLEACVHFGKRFVDFEMGANDVVARFEDGSSTRADLLVGADGVHSLVRRQYLPDAEPKATGAHAIFGRTPLRDLTLPALGPLLEKSGVLSLGPRGVNFFCTTMRFPEPPAIVADRLRLDLGTCPSEDYVMWGVTSRVDSHATDPHRLKSAALALIEGFAGDFDTLVRASDVDDTITVPIRAAPKLTRWKPSRVTLLGDAIHAMPPVGANGANTALRDAQVLARCLSRGDAIEDAVGSYENEMRAYSRRLVRRGTRMMSAITSPSPLARGLLRATLRVAAWLA